MDATERRRLAEELLAKASDFMADEDVCAWPWYPFRQPCDEELKDRRRQRAIRTLVDKTDAKLRLQAAEELIKLGGYQILEDGTVELQHTPYHFSDHNQRLEKFESLSEFRREFQRHITKWNGEEPDWNHLKQEFLNHELVRLTELDGLTLIDVRTALPNLAKKRSANTDAKTKRAQQSRTPRKPLTQRKRAPKITLREKVAWTLVVGRGMTHVQAAAEMGCRRQNVDKLMARISEKIEAGASPRTSVQHKTNRDRLDQRGASLDDDD